MHPMKDQAKKEAFKKLLAEMMEDSVKKDPMEMMMGGDAPMKATIMADDEEGLIEGAKALPDALSKAEEYMKSEMGGMPKKDKKKKK